MHNLPLEDDSPKPLVLGEKTAGILLTTFQDFYRQEISAEEDVHRTLPFFATSLGLIFAALTYAASQLPTWDVLTKSCGPPSKVSVLDWMGCGWPILLAGALLAISALCGVAVLFFLARATKRRTYDRVGSESDQLSRAKALRDYHHASGLNGISLDDNVLADLREQLLEDYAIVLPHNRKLNLRRYLFRARAVSGLLWSLSAAIIATILIVLSSKIGLLQKVAP